MIWTKVVSALKGLSTVCSITHCNCGKSLILALALYEMNNCTRISVLSEKVYHLQNKAVLDISARVPILSEKNSIYKINCT